MDITTNPIITLGRTVVFCSQDGTFSTAEVAEEFGNAMANLKLVCFGEYAPGSGLVRNVWHQSLAQPAGLTQWWIYPDEYTYTGPAGPSAPESDNTPSN